MFHPLQSDLPRPMTLNDPFCYEPDPLCLLAVEEVKRYLQQQSDWQEEVAAGKMFGVLVCEAGDGRLGFLAAYSGQIQGRENHEWFVPAVFDYLQPDGYFKHEEAEITAINHRISALEQADDYVAARASLTRLTREAADEIDAYKERMKEAKARRDALREGRTVNRQDEEVLVRESQFQKAELHRLKQRWQQQLHEAEAYVKTFSEPINHLKHERKRRSDALQHWLFDHFVMVNEVGEHRSLTEIFAQTPQGVPPSGSGECCAPKLLQYAFLHHLKPLCMAEFWQGRSPKMEVRHHNHFYPACQGKCGPILGWQAKASPSPSEGKASPSPSKGGGVYIDDKGGTFFDNEKRGVYRDNEQASIKILSHIRIFSNSLSNIRLSSNQTSPPSEGLGEAFEAFIISKPSGLLSVPGKSGAPSVESILRERYPTLRMVHRLDMDTSGMMVVALTEEAYHNLQRQFENHTIRKRYIAMLDGEVHGKGTINLPLRPDLNDRPRQLVDHEHGKEATTDYEVLAVEHGRTRIALTPHTGRTHQLRMHCAHQEGLGVPILGDRLYGRAADRLYLHAEMLSFRHPVTGEWVTFTDPCPF